MSTTEKASPVARESQTTMRVAAITAIPTPYRDPFWNVLASQPGIELDVYYCAGGKSDRPWEQSWRMDYHAEVLKGFNSMRMLSLDSACYVNPAIWRRLRDGGYHHLIIGGYNHATMWAAMLYARMSGIPYYLMCETYLEQPRSSWRKAVKAPIVRSVVRHATAYLPTGTLASNYLEYYGADPEEFYSLPNTPDVDAQWEKAQQLESQRPTLRKELGLHSTRPVILFVGRLIPRKGVDVLLRAYALVCQQYEADLVVLGDSALRDNWESMARELGVNDKIRFEGFVAPGDVPTWHAVADLLVLPSLNETWSTVVLESLASGLPVVITRRVGCYADVLNDPIVGTAVEPGNAEQLAEAIEHRLTHPVTRHQVAEAWAPVRQQLRYETLARRLVAALERHHPTSVSRSSNA